MSLPVITTQVLSVRPLGDAAAELRLQRLPGFHFRPGQRLRVHWDAGDRDYSIASAPGENDLLICVRRVAGGAVSPRLAALAPGAPVSISGPYGHFRFQASTRRAVFVATGTGIAPFRAMVAACGRCGDALVLHGVRSAADLYYRELFSRKAGDYVACISGGGDAGNTHAFKGRVTDYLARCLPRGRYTFYVCGRQDMIRDVIHIVDDRFTDARIFTEAFY